jgi:D-alanyl-D-alanine carboxypeptidase
MKRLIGAALVIGMLLISMPGARAVGTSASSAILMEAESGRILYGENIRERRLIASTTKLMTALVALESGHQLDEVVTVDAAWVGVEGSSLYLQAGEEITLEALLYGLLLRSGNDAALAIAGYCGESVEGFVAQMNEKAVQLGMVDSHFSNPNGLNADDHYASAYDMALLARACLENETLRTITATKSITLGNRTFTNHNKLLWRYEGCIGMKTGYTEKAGRTLVSAAERDGMTLICVTLNDPDDWADHTALFQYGFQTYQRKELAVAGEIVGRLPVAGGLLPTCPVILGESAALCVASGETVEREVLLLQTALEAPVSAGDPVGEVIYSCDGKEVCRIPLLAGADISDARALEQGRLQRFLRDLMG